MRGVGVLYGTPTSCIIGNGRDFREKNIGEILDEENI